MSRFYVVVTAAGRSRRMGGQNKMLIPLGDRPVLCHTISRFQNSALVEAVAVFQMDEQHSRAMQAAIFTATPCRTAIISLTA